MPELAFFVGKGGVGKTTVAAAYAVRTALKNSRSRVLLVSTDPAHSLHDIFQRKLGSSVTAVALRSARRVWVWEIDSGHLFHDFLRHYKNKILQIVERGSLFTAEEISPLLDSALPGMAEIAGLLAIRKSIDSGKYSHVVIDTAPFGHTLRLFSMPEQFERLLNFLQLAAERDQVLAEHFGSRAEGWQPKLLEDWRDQIERLASAFSNSSLFLVTTPERFALNESVRCVKDLRNGTPELQVKTIVLNRVAARADGCPICRKRVLAARKAKEFLKRSFSSVELHIGEDHGFPISGCDALQKFGAHIFDRKKFNLKPRLPKSKATLKIQSTEWPKLASGISFVAGKGGVGKTTVSAALGFHARQTSNLPIELCSVDPAPSLDDIFQTAVADTPVAVLGDQHFHASELDSLALFRSWIAELKDEVNSATSAEDSGIHVDLSFERRLLSALLDIVPPGLDEVLAIFRISDMRASGSGRIIIDMAPTGHALELLRTPERIVSWSRVLLKSLVAHRKLSLARNAAARVAELEVRARELLKAFSNCDEVSIFSVMLPEPLPDHETERLLEELSELGLRPQTLFVNRVTSLRDAVNCIRCRTASQWQASVLESLRRKTAAKDVFVIRNFPDEIAGAKGLRSITRELWRLQ